MIFRLEPLWSKLVQITFFYVTYSIIVGYTKARDLYQEEYCEEYPKPSNEGYDHVHRGTAGSWIIVP